MVGYDAVHSAIQHSLTHCLHMVPATQGRAYTSCRAIVRACFVSQGQVMHGNLAGYIDALLFSLTNDIDSTLGSNMADVHMCASIFSDDAIASYSNILRDGGHAGHANASRNCTLMHIAFSSQLRVDSVEHQRFIKSSDVFGSQHEQAGALYIVTVIGEAYCSSISHVTHFGQLFTLFALGNSANYFNISIAFLSSALFNAAYDNSRIYDGLSIRHAGYSGYTAGSSSHSTGNNVFLSLQTGLTHMGMHIDKAGGYNETGCIIYFISSFGNAGSHCFNLAILYQDVHYSV